MVGEGLEGTDLQEESKGWLKLDVGEDHFEEGLQCWQGWGKQEPQSTPGMVLFFL